MIEINFNKKLNNVYLYALIAVTTLMGPLLYIKVISLFHLVILGLSAVLLVKGLKLPELNTTVVKFTGFWVLEALISCVWAPDTATALMYFYYIFLILALALLTQTYINKENIIYFFRLFVIILFVCNVIAVWETFSGNHISIGYLNTPLRERLLKYLPAVFFHNPNDFATYVIQVIPFSFACIYDKKLVFKIMSFANILVSMFTIFASQSRTQTIIILIMVVFFMIFSKKSSIIKIILGAIAMMTLLSFLIPAFSDVILAAFESISEKEIQESLIGGSLNSRMKLMYNGVHMLVNTFGFGVGAGCHRVLMPQYSLQYYDTKEIYVMHNLLAEIFVDYGLIIGITFLIVLVVLCVKLFSVFKKNDNMMVKIASIMLFFSMATFVLCGISSSSILQLTSLWTGFCASGAMINIYARKKKTEKT